MKNLLLRLFWFIAIVLSIASCNENKKKGKDVITPENMYNKPFKGSNPNKEGYVPDELTAIKIAEAIWLPIYGEKIRDYEPFKASLSGDSTWVVTGTIHTSEGGAPFAFIQKKDGRILDVYHEK